jgi:hypothetical protein
VPAKAIFLRKKWHLLTGSEVGSACKLGRYTLSCRACRPIAPLLCSCWSSCALVTHAFFAAAPKAPKTHTVTLGAYKRVPYTPADSTQADKTDESSTLKIRPLFVDERQKEWTLGEIHDVTDRSFAVRRALRLNDSLPSDSVARWVWQPGPWLLVDRATGHITALHLPNFDADVSDVVWFRDYAAYCGVATTVKGGLLAVVAQINGRKAVV